MFNFLKKVFVNKEINTNNKPKDISYEDELLQQFGKNENSLTNHVSLLIITDTHNCL